jgi:PEP-CTERM/exosortase A-associated glycosyltransferase
MRILHVLDHSLPLHSGYSFRTVAILREQRALGWETFHVTTPRHGTASAETESADGWTFYRTRLSNGLLARLPGIGTYFGEMLATARRLEGLITTLRPDILHAHSPVLTALPALWAARCRKIPVVYEVRALWEDGAVDHGTTTAGSLRYRLTRAIETFVLKHVARVTTICEGLRREIAARGISESHITVVPNAVDTESFAFDPPPDQSLRGKLGLQGQTVLGFIGSFYGYEGLEMLIESFALMCKRRSDLRLVFVGGGIRESAMRARVAELGLQEHVVFAGRVPHDEVQKFYSVIDMLVYPRLSVRVTEIVTPLKPLEAMAQGRIVIASDVGGHRELVHDCETGFLFRAGDVVALADTVDAVLMRRASWPQIREQARCYVESERTWKASVARYLDTYAGALRVPVTQLE